MHAKVCAAGTSRGILCEEGLASPSRRRCVVAVAS